MRIVVLDGFTADQGQADAWRELDDLGAVTVHPRTRPNELAERCAGAEALLTNKVPLDTALLTALPDLRYVGVTATGTNVVDIAAARAHGVAVTNVPGYAADSVAQLVLALLLHFAHRVADHGRATQAGKWASAPDFCFFDRQLVELSGKVLVVVGMGAIGGAVSRIATGFGMEVLAAAVPGRPAGAARAAGPLRRPLEEVLPRADVVSLHCPLTPATERLVNARFLELMKRGAWLINTSRGGLLDEPALLQALTSGRLGAAGLDVLTEEPPPADHPLLNPAAPFADRLVVTPHIGWGTVEARARLRQEVASNLRAFLAGERRNRVD